VWQQDAAHLVLVEDDIAAEPLELVALATALAVPRTLDGIPGHAGFRSVLHPRHPVTMRIQEPHPRPGRKDDDQVARDHLVVFVSVDNLERFAERQEMRSRIRRGDPAHAAEVFAVEDVAGDVPAKQPRLRRGDLRRDLCEVRVRMLLGELLVPAPRCAGAGIKPKCLKCVASLAQAWDALRATSPWGCRDIHDAAQLAIAFANAYRLLVFHCYPPFGREDRGGSRPRSLVTLVVGGWRTTKQKGGLRRPRVIWLGCWG